VEHGVPLFLTGEPARELVDRLLEQAARDGAAVALRFSHSGRGRVLIAFGNQRDDRLGREQKGRN
jgi:serine/threonine protein kinase HipA of HipAB toxin-antitoxin module